LINIQDSIKQSANRKMSNQKTVEKMNMRPISAIFLMLWLLISCTLSSGTLADQITFDQVPNQAVVDQTTYGKVHVTRSDLSNCQFHLLADGDHLSLTFQKADVQSDSTQKAHLKCRIETTVIVKPEAGSYVESIQYKIDGGITQSAGSTVSMSIKSTFAHQPVLQLNETASATSGGGEILRSGIMPVDFIWPKAKQCANPSKKRWKGKISLTLDMKTQGTASARLDDFDVVMNHRPCN
jgi:hypothetical protein